MPYIEELIEAIKTADKLEFQDAFKEYTRKYPDSKGHHPHSAFMMHGSRKVLWLDFDIEAKDLTEDILTKIEPDLRKSGIISINFRGPASDPPTNVEKRLHAIIDENDPSPKIGKKPRV